MGTGQPACDVDVDKFALQDQPFGSDMSALESLGNVVDKCSLAVLWIDVDKSVLVTLEINACMVVVGSQTNPDSPQSTSWHWENTWNIWEITTDFGNNHINKVGIGIGTNRFCLSK